MAGPAGWLWGAHLKPFTESTLHRPQQVPAVLLLLRLWLARQLGPRKSPLCGGLAGLHIRVISSSDAPGGHVFRVLPSAPAGGHPLGTSSITLWGAQFPASPLPAPCPIFLPGPC